MKIQRVYSKDIAARNILIRPPEPTADMVIPKFEEGEWGVYLGKTALLKNYVYWMPESVANPHWAIFGKSGWGKSVTIKTLLVRAAKEKKLNAIILDFANEYTGFVLRSRGHVLSLGEKDFLNILDLGGMNPGQRAEQIITSLTIAFDLENAPRQKRMLRTALRRAYRDAGIVDENPETWKKRTPTMKEVYDIVRAEEDMADEYGKVAKRESLTSLSEKIEAYITPPNDVLARQSTIKLDEITRSGLVNVNLSKLPDERARTAVALSILDFLVEKMRKEGWTDRKEIRTLIVCDEAWKVAKDDSSPAVTIIREGRKYGFALIVATQNLDDVNESVINNAGTVVLLRIENSAHIEKVSKGLGLPERLKLSIPALKVGEAVTSIGFSEKVKIPFIMKVDAELAEKKVKIAFEEAAKIWDYLMKHELPRWAKLKKPMMF